MYISGNAPAFLSSAAPGAPIGRSGFVQYKCGRSCAARTCVGFQPRTKTQRRRCRGEVRTSVRMAFNFDPWSVSADLVAGQFFALSLFPYLGFLYHLQKKETRCPKDAVRGFRFLLVFVFATIPAGIAAKNLYNDILANVDWLHGCAESMLTITNLWVLLGFKTAEDTPTPQPADGGGGGTSSKLRTPGAATAAAALATGATMWLSQLTGGPHPEPANALSVITWVIHISSLIEWLGAMDLVWERASITGNERWKGLTWGMLPLHSSGLLACTYHLFYNAPNLSSLVAMQAALTFVGNACMWRAAYRIFEEEERRGGYKPSPAAATASGATAAVAPESSGSGSGEFIKLAVISVVASFAVKYGELYFDFPFQPGLPVALAFVLFPTGLNSLKWALRSRSG